MRVAIQGQAGSFHEQVAQSWYGKNIDLVFCATFEDTFAAFEEDEADAVVSAVENTIYGSINQVYQLIEDSAAPIIGEVELAIEQQLIALPNTKLSDITEVYSHPVALAQCREYLDKYLPQAEVIEYFDTAGAVEFIQENQQKNAAAIASAKAARLYGLPILQTNIHDKQHNQTRFVVLEDRDSDADANKSMLVITAANKPGALYEILGVFAKANINLSHLKSQPVTDEAWKYKFYITVDCAGDKLYEVVQEIETSDHQVALLGEYKSA